MVMAILLFRARIVLKNISLDKQNLQEALVQTIAVYAKYRSFLKRTVRAMFFASILLSFSIAKIPEYGTWTVVLFALVFCVGIGFSFYYGGKKLQWDNLGEEEKGFQADLEELKELNPQ